VPKLIYDIGLHAGEDSGFYLRKGFRVIGVDADDAMCRATCERLGRYVENGRLEIVNVAIADRSGEAPFYRNVNPQWSTLVPAWRDQNAAKGSPSMRVDVRTITLAELVSRYGDAFYMKIDIEGMDLQALQSLGETSIRPTFISIESAFPRDPSFKSIDAELRTLAELGYDRFKIVPQHEVESQEPPSPALVGRYVRHRFEPGSSGLFGDEAPGDWMTLAETRDAFKSIVRRSRLPALLHRKLRLYRLYSRIVQRVTGSEPDLGWYDIHAALAVRSPAPSRNGRSRTNRRVAREAPVPRP